MNQINPRVPRKQQSSGDDDSTTGGIGMGGRYGAAELKASYSRYMLYGLGISAGLFILLSGSYTIFVTPGKADASKMRKAPTSTTLASIETPPPAEESAPPPPPPMVPENLRGSGGVAAVIGKPKPVPDATIDPKLKPIADVNTMTVATSTMGTGGGVTIDESGLDPSKINLENKNATVKTKEEPLPNIDDFVATEEDASYDQEDLKRRIKYPPAARDQGIEGTVVVRALVDKYGKIARVVIDRSDNKILENAAINAVKETPFTAAIQNKQPVATWKQVEVEFRLGN